MKTAAALLLTETGIPPFQPAPRFRQENFCGIRVPGLPFIDGGSADYSLVYMPFYPRYTPSDRANIRAGYVQRGLTHVTVSAPDCAYWDVGVTGMMQALTEWRSLGPSMYPGAFLSSKIWGPFDDPQWQIDHMEPYVSALLASPCCTWACIGWELNLWLSPEHVQTLIDAWAPRFVAKGVPVYVHFGPGIFAWQPNGQPTAAFWNTNVGKLTGLLYQRNLSEDVGFYYERIHDDCLTRFAGFDGFSPDSGFGHPFDFVAWEINASLEFNEESTEAEGNAVGAGAIGLPPVTGPTGVVTRVMGSGNGL